ncbi:MAG TPA: aldo/keto reductase, partial [Isosphaeraceae bacterium]|nr:aldo/keto reductase [Isosphaeraceae bacterium]
TEKKIPALADKGLSLYQGLLQAIWSDERIASACVSMRNTDQIRENVEAARKFAENGPLKTSEIHQIRDAVIAMGNSTLCPDCDGRCSVAGGTNARLGDLTRYLTYHEHHGDRSSARQQYAQLTDSERNWKDADLAAARDACPGKLDFARLLPEVDRHLA